jgi:hypothetical protein
MSLLPLLPLRSIGEGEKVPAIPVSAASEAIVIAVGSSRPKRYSKVRYDIVPTSSN